MTKDLAIAHLLANFAYIDNEIHDAEIKKIKDISKKLNLKVDFDSIFSSFKENANNEELEEYAQALAFLNLNLDKDEKIKILRYAIEIIEADGKVMDKEVIKLQLVSKSWDIDVKKVFSLFLE
ncbi:MAG: hypothetical protein A2086_05280 [Spirochaetes bacterium GWD1_27_9]|nr:MAG: hypothetical protein A2Z98_04950 [Spirochaetes bacterium GWB1_27_13]OHD24658.1 MAG: hypothetical protein A2Y34_03350 [Spirochaetes bacterium GWC1_27_15]OHD45035.1 MAG: hypothetical protein A2086_05280 [Spirochaetes bacterium GWD1_27_9]